MTEDKETLPENTWKCSNCGNTLVEIKPPEICPVCKQKCAFLNVWCG
jgi:rubrerythrin